MSLLGDSLSPVGSFLIVALATYLLLAAAAIGTGFVLTEVLLKVGFVARWDGNVESWLAHHRSGWLTDASWIGSTIAGGIVIPAVVGVLACIFAFQRRWQIAAFLSASICIEVATYRVTTLLVHRQRPNVHRLEDLAANASYPSGHTAASIARLRSDRAAGRLCVPTRLGARLVRRPRDSHRALRRFIAHVQRNAPPA